MKVSWSLIAVAALIAVASADPAFARAKHKVKVRCVDQPYQFSWSSIWPGNPEPRPNGCSPPVYNYGKFIGQDPDRNIRQQLLRDPATGYSAHTN